MSQTHAHIVLHLVFSTKNRVPLIDKTVKDPLHAYLATVCREQGCHAYRVGGVEDHVHIATTLSRTMTVAKLIEHLKSSSSSWMKSQGNAYTAFYWQGGYGAFSVSPKDLDALIRYIEGQEEHHRTKTFQEEYLQFLKQYNIPYDPKYIWE